MKAFVSATGGPTKMRTEGRQRFEHGLKEIKQLKAATTMLNANYAELKETLSKASIFGVSHAMALKSERCYLLQHPAEFRVAIYSYVIDLPLPEFRVSPAYPGDRIAFQDDRACLKERSYLLRASRQIMSVTISTYQKLLRSRVEFWGAAAEEAEKRMVQSLFVISGL